MCCDLVAKVGTIRHGGFNTSKCTPQETQCGIHFLNFLCSEVSINIVYYYNQLLLDFRKYEEIYPPDVREFVYITDDTYTKKQVLRMEHLILKVLAFDLSVPTTLSFITSFSVSNDLSEMTMFLAMVSTSHLYF